MKGKNRIIVIGSGGAGKSTLCVKLGQKTGIPVIHLDSLYWKENWTPLAKEEFDKLLMLELEKPEWIIDGNFNRTLPLRLEAADYAVFLDFPPITCVLGVLKRVICNYGKTRPDMGPNCPERFDLSFLKWVWRFRKQYRNQYMKLLQDSGKEFIILKNRKDCSLFLDNFH